MSAMSDFLREYGTRGPRLLVGRLIELAPSFPGDGKLAEELGIMMSKLEVLLEIESSTRSIRANLNDAEKRRGGPRPTI